MARRPMPTAEAKITIGDVSAQVIPPGFDVDWPLFAGAFPPMDLPAGAEQQADGSVMLTLDYPVTVTLGASGARLFDVLALSRLNGTHMRRILAAKDGNNLALALALGLSPAHLHLLRSKMDASDVTAAGKCVAAMLDMAEGLPERAVRHPDGSVTLPLLAPDGVDDITLRRLTGADLDAIRKTEGADTLIWLTARATGRTPKEMGDLFDRMDGADISGLQRVASFLAGGGR